MSARRIIGRILRRKPAKPTPRPRYIDTAYGSHDRLSNLDDRERMQTLGRLEQSWRMPDARRSS